MEERTYEQTANTSYYQLKKEISVESVPCVFFRAGISCLEHLSTPGLNTVRGSDSSTPGLRMREGGRAEKERK
ncbi:hypothetical protein PoB_003245000 [Plakobranchus ocellatus]|uniref:Uncharacterized protein n=1 Tax=Plakobranchus ocellatus TaxID=259542 RepID=A0AAV4AEY1_9GAST|nr:hypothetical protein PoB_003245000 [Plakobranchus ocellatus]